MQHDVKTEAEKRRALELAMKRADAMLRRLYNQAEKRRQAA